MATTREQLIRNAEKYVTKGKLDAAIREYRKVLAENPNDANTLNRVGDLYARIERFDEAVKLFSQIAEQYTQDGFFVKAIAIYKKIIKLDPSSLQVYEKLAELYHKQGLLNEARTQYQVLADYYVKHDNATSATNIYQRMVEIEPENPSYHLKLAELFDRQRLSEKAIRAYRQLADLFMVGGSIGEATQVYVKIVELSRNDLETIRKTVVELHDGGHVTAAAQVLARAVEVNPEARAIAQQIGLKTAAGATSARGKETPAEAPPEPDEIFPVSRPIPVRPAPPPPVEPAVDDTFSFEPEADDAFEIPATSFSDLDEQLSNELFAPAAASSATSNAISDAEEDGSVFTLDLDDDEEPESLVKPPPDMLEAPIGLGTGRISGTMERVAWGAAEEEEIVIEIEGLDHGAFAEIEAAASDVARLAPEGEAVGQGEAESEIDWDAEPAEPEPPEFPFGFEPPAAAGPDPFAAAEEPEPAFEPDFETEIELELETELEIEQVAEEPVEEPAEEPVEEPIEELAGELPEAPAEESAEELEAIVARSLRREEDLLAEAQVFAKYGLKEKAEDRLRDLLELRPGSVGGLALLTRLRLEAGKTAEVVEYANQVAAAAREAGDGTAWAELRRQLSESGYTLQGDRVVAEPGAPRPRDEDRIAQLLEDLTGSFKLPSKADLSAAAAKPPAPPAEPVPPPPPEAPPSSTGKRLISLADELDLDALDEELEAPVLPRSVLSVDSGSLVRPIEASDAVADMLDETGMSWLDEVSAEEQVATRNDEKIFDEEDDFFDLAAELERELRDDDSEDLIIPQPQEQTLEEIVEGFKRGVAEHLSPDDYDTHFNLGIAYREMGLLDEAIGEFQIASKDERHLVECSSMLGICFQEKGLAELALKWYRKGLECPGIREEQTLGLLYDMGYVYLSLGDNDAAYKTFIEIYGLNSHYRDVSARVQELRALQ